MSELIKKSALFILLVITTSCSDTLSDDEFVYLGHGEATPDYQLYYDKTQHLFMLIDKHNGCFKKDDTGTCLAFTIKQTRNFREKVLSKLIKLDVKLAKDAQNSYAINELDKAGITTINKHINVGEVYAIPVRQIILNRKQLYYLVNDEYKINVNLVAMVITNPNSQKRIKVVYIIDFPGIDKRYHTDLRPYVINPEYLYKNMTMDTVYKKNLVQKNIMNDKEHVKEKIDKYLETALLQLEPSGVNEQKIMVSS